MTDSFATWDAAYLVGALTPADRAAFEVHLTECADCRRSVNQLAGLPGLLAGVTEERVRSVGEPMPAVPQTLLPRLLREVQRTRFRRRVTTGLVGIAAAAVLAIALIVGLRSTGSDDGTHQAVQPLGQRTMSPISAEVPIRASARLDGKAWGTRIVVRCVYTGEPDKYPEGPHSTYTMVVTDDSGATQQIAAWEAKPGAPIVVDGSTSVPRSEISSVQVRDWTNEPILTLDL